MGAPATLPPIEATAPGPLTALPGGGPAVRVHGIVIEGHRSIDEATLQALVADAVGGAWTLAQLEALAARLTLYYRQQGYLVARAYVPAQDLTDGQLRLRVVEGMLGRVLLDNRSRVSNERLQSRLDRLTALPALRLAELEHALLSVNDLPGARVGRADLLPGQTTGSTDLALVTEATAPVIGQITLDNQGSRYTGRERLGLQAEWASPTGQGDRLSLGMLSSAGGGLAHGRVAWSVPVSVSGTRIEGALARTRYSLGDRFAALGASGTAEGVELNLLHPLQRSRVASIDLGLGLSKRRLADETASVGITLGKRTEALALRAQGQWQHAWIGQEGVSQATATLTTGRLEFDDALAALQDAVGARTAGHWSKLELSAAHTASWSSAWQLALRARLQRALGGKNLDGSERMAISGANGVQVYASGEAAGDHGALVQAELSRGLGSWGKASVRGGAFAAAGTTSVVHPVGAWPSHRRLADAGLVLTLASGHWQLRGALAHRLQGGAARSEPTSATRLLVQAALNF